MTKFTQASGVPRRLGLVRIASGRTKLPPASGGVITLDEGAAWVLGANTSTNVTVEPFDLQGAEV